MKTLAACWFVVVLSARLGRLRLIRATVLVLAGYVAAPFAAFAISRLTANVTGGAGPALTLALFAAALLVAQLMLGHFAHLDYNELAELTEEHIRLDAIGLVNGPGHIDHLDSPGFADTLAIVREDLMVMGRTLEAVLQFVGLLLQGVLTTVFLMWISPWLAVLLFVAVPPLFINRWAHAVIERSRLAGAEQRRLAEYLLHLATTPSSVKELRLCGAEDELLRRHAIAWRHATRHLRRGQLAGVGVRTLGQLIVSVGYGAAILLLLREVLQGRAGVGELILAVMLAIQVNVQVAGIFGLLSRLQTAAEMVGRLEELRRTSRARAAADTVHRSAAAVQMRHSLRFDRVCFAYPGATEAVVRDVSFEVPAGSTLALVGENGAGKSTLVKLLCGMYRPTSGRILVDGVDIATLGPAEWQARIATLFQDFARFEFTLRESIGLGDVAAIDDPAAVSAAVDRAHADGVVRSVPAGLDGVVGRGYAEGVDLSGGQWQTVALARCMMREYPPLRVLDEPAAALDALAEQGLFERYAAGDRRSTVTVLVSHRFTTVRMADAIAVLRQGQLMEYGTHDELMARPRLYAELFRLQARAYE